MRAWGPRVGAFRCDTPPQIAPRINSLLNYSETEMDAFESSESFTVDGAGMAEIIYPRKNSLVTGANLSDVRRVIG